MNYRKFDPLKASDIGDKLSDNISNNKSVASGGNVSVDANSTTSFKVPDPPVPEIPVPEVPFGEIPIVEPPHIEVPQPEVPVPMANIETEFPQEPQVGFYR